MGPGKCEDVAKSQPVLIMVKPMCHNMDPSSRAPSSEEVHRALQLLSHNGWPLSRCGRSLPANASGVDTHRDSIRGSASSPAAPAWAA
jgi:hypothetical protein